MWWWLEKRRSDGQRRRILALRVIMALVSLPIVMAIFQDNKRPSPNSISFPKTSHTRGARRRAILKQEEEGKYEHQEQSEEEYEDNFDGRAWGETQPSREKEIERALEILEDAGIVHLESSDGGWSITVEDGTESKQYEWTSPRRLGEESESSEPKKDESELEEDEEDLFNGLMAFLCVCLAALAAGLTMGLLSLDPLMLMIKIRAGSSQKERDNAAALLPLVRQHHFLLVTLLLLNSMANEALPIFLDRIVPSYIAVILSVTFVLFFGEIIPSALFTGPNQMAIASALVPLVRLVMLILCPLSWPIAKVLDYVLHDEDDDHGGVSMYNRGELSALVRIQYEERIATKKRRKEEMARMAAIEREKIRLEEQKSLSRSSSSAALLLSSALDSIKNSFSTLPPNIMTTTTKTETSDSVDVYPSGPLPDDSESPLLLLPSDPEDSILLTPMDYGAVTLESTVPLDSASETKRRTPLRSTSSLSEYLSATSPTPATIAVGIDDEATDPEAGSLSTPNSRNSIVLDEVAMVEGALAMKTRVALDVYTPLKDVFAVPLDMELNENNVVEIYSRGFSRVPVYVPGAETEGDPHFDDNTVDSEEKDEHMAICGFLLTKQLIVVNPKDCRPISTLPLHLPQCVSPTTNLVDLINMFQTGGKANKGGHMALVCVDPDEANKALDRGDVVPLHAGVMGVVTFEDVIEELLQEQIYDEMDKAEQEMMRRARWVVRKWKIFVKKRKLARKKLALLAGRELPHQSLDAEQPRTRSIELDTAPGLELKVPVLLEASANAQPTTAGNQNKMKDPPKQEPLTVPDFNDPFPESDCPPVNNQFMLPDPDDDDDSKPIFI